MNLYLVQCRKCSIIKYEIENGGIYGYINISVIHEKEVKFQAVFRKRLI